MQPKIFVKLPQIRNEKGCYKAVDERIHLKILKEESPDSVSRRDLMPYNKVKLISFTPDISTLKNKLLATKSSSSCKKRSPVKSLSTYQYKRGIYKKKEPKKLEETKDDDESFPILTIPHHYHFFDVNNFEPRIKNISKSFESKTKLSLWDYYVNRRMVRYP